MREVHIMNFKPWKLLQRCIFWRRWASNSLYSDRWSNSTSRGIVRTICGEFHLRIFERVLHTTLTPLTFFLIWLISALKTDNIDLLHKRNQINFLFYSSWNQFMSHFTPAFKLVLRPSLYVPNILEFLKFLKFS